MSQKWMCVNMGMFVNPDNLAFQAALNARIYVDKSGILNYTNSVLGSTDAFICNSRPRRFGKSVTANMLTAYYSKGCDSEEMFSRLEISQAEDFRKHLNQYDVIHWDIQWCMGPANGPEKVVSYISEKTISELREYYPDVLPAENHSLAETLARINTVTGRKFIVIIDEWDVLIRDEAAKEDIQNEYIRFLRGIFKGTELTKYIQLAYLTGILSIKKEKAQSAVNSLDEFTMLQADELAPYIVLLKRKLRAPVEKQKQELEASKRIIEERDAKIRKQNIQIDNMIQALLHARKTLFGPSTEVNKQVEGQLSLFETVQELAEALELSKKNITVSSHKRVPRKPGIRKEMLAGLPVEVEEYIIPEDDVCSVCGGKLKVTMKKNLV